MDVQAPYEALSGFVTLSVKQSNLLSKSLQVTLDEGKPEKGQKVVL